LPDLSPRNLRSSDWRRLFVIACDLLDQAAVNSGGYPFDWSFGGGTAMMIQIGHRESHDIDIFLDDPQVLGFFDPAKADLRFARQPAEYIGDCSRFQKFTFSDLGEIDFIVSGALTPQPFIDHDIDGRAVKLETLAEIIAKKVFYRGRMTRPRDMFDIAAAARSDRNAVLAGLRQFPRQVADTLSRLDTLAPDYVNSSISQLMIRPDYRQFVPSSLDVARSLLVDALAS
jgi:hypothetical protein